MSKRELHVRELLGGLFAKYKTPQDPIGKQDLGEQLTKLLVSTALDVEMTEQQGIDR